MSAIEFPPVGKTASIEVQILPDHVKQFVALSGDDAPLHTDEDFAKSHGFSGTLVHGALLAAYVSRLVGTILPGHESLLQRMELGFSKPCHAPVRLTVEGVVRQVSEATHSLIMDVKILRKGSAVAMGKTHHLLLVSK